MRIVDKATLLLHTPPDAELLKFASLRGAEALFTVPTFEQGAYLALVRRHQQQLDHHNIDASTDARGIAPGYIFTLCEHPCTANNANYLIISARYDFVEHSERSDWEDTHWNIQMTVKPSSQQFRPPRRTPKSRVPGSQTAVVTGPQGQEVFTNEYGQIKVHFRWDRYSKFDENSACWIRVANSWSGATWGDVMLPRIGQEVVVHYLDGDPGLPLIIGSVNNEYLVALGAQALLEADGKQYAANTLILQNPPYSFEETNAEFFDGITGGHQQTTQSRIKTLSNIVKYVWSKKAVAPRPPSFRPGGTPSGIVCAPA